MSKGKVGRKWLTVLIQKFSEARERLWNSKKVMFFFACHPSDNANSEIGAEHPGADHPTPEAVGTGTS